MRNSIRIPISTMIKLLKEISSGGCIYKSKSIHNTTSKLSSLFNQEISSFNMHYILTKNLLMKKDPILSDAYQLLFRKYLKVIFSIFYKIKIKFLEHRKKFNYIVKNLPNYRLYMEVKKIMDDFFVEEKNKFNTDEMSKSFFILNSFFETDEDDESESNDSTCQNDDEEMNF